MPISNLTVAERNNYAAECYEKLKEGTITLCEYARANNLSSKCLRSWICSRYNVNIRDLSNSFVKPSSGFIKVPNTNIGSNVTIEYYGAKVNVTDFSSLRTLFKAIKDASI